MHKFHGFRVLLLSMLLTAGCGGSGGSGGGGGDDDSDDAGNPATTALGTFGGTCTTPKKIVGYFPYWAGLVDDIQFNQLTHIMYAFLLPSLDGGGGLQAINNEAKLQELVVEAHANSKLVGIAIGGWDIGAGGGNDTAFAQLADNTDGSRDVFISNVMNFVDNYDLDGVDIDWEYPDPGVEANNYTLLMDELATALHAEGKFLSAAVLALGSTAAGIEDAVFNDIDFLNLMAYDENSGNHSSYDYAVRTVNYWRGRGLPREKAVLGVPFYARPSWDSYKNIVAADADNACRNKAGDDYYNGVPTIRRKAAIADSEVCGIMAWELSHDSLNADSLLMAVWERVNGMGGSYDCD